MYSYSMCRLVLAGVRGESREEKAHGVWAWHRGRVGSCVWRPGQFVGSVWVCCVQWTMHYIRPCSNWWSWSIWISNNDISPDLAYNTKTRCLLLLCDLSLKTPGFIPLHVLFSCRLWICIQSIVITYLLKLRKAIIWGIERDLSVLFPDIA